MMKRMLAMLLALAMILTLALPPLLRIARAPRCRRKRFPAYPAGDGGSQWRNPPRTGAL